jgi:outer membrane receptor protein involved in Fe transport
MGYITISEGFRIGASNGVALCPDPLPQSQQIVCALPHEAQYFPDTTTNYEIGMRSQWFDRRITFNASLYHIEWNDPQLFSQTVNGAQPITVNGQGAASDGLEISFNAFATDRLELGFSYAYTDAELTATAPGLLRVFEPPGFGPSPAVYIDGQSGDRLPGSPRQQGTVTVNYAFDLDGGWGVDLNYGLAAVGEMLTKVGGRVGSEPLGGYTVHSAALTFARDALQLGVYAQNLTNKYALTGLRTQPQYLQTVADENGDPVTVRAYTHSVLRPREIGFKISYDLDM